MTRTDKDPYFMQDFDRVHLSGGVADGQVVYVNKGVEKLSVNHVDTDVKLDGLFSNRPPLNVAVYKRLAETNIFSLRT